MEERIGAPAGVVWQYLVAHGPTTVAQLKRGTKLADAVLLMSLGWLAREDKLTFESTRRGLRVHLREPAA